MKIKNIKLAETTPLFKNTATSSYSSLQKATEAMCKHKSAGGKIGLCFSMFETSKDDSGDIDNWIVNHPDIWSDEPVLESNCIFFSDYWRIADKPVYSEVMPMPRWREIIAECNRQLIDPEDGSTACLFLEGFYEFEPRSDGTRVFEVVWGS